MFRVSVVTSGLVVLLVARVASVTNRVVDRSACGVDPDCGWNSYCDHGQCWCKTGYQRGVSGTHCLDRSCSVANCIQCLDASSCRRCATYLLAGTGRCVESCQTEYTLMIEGEEVGRICRGELSGISMIYVLIIVAAVSAVLLIILLTVAIHYKIKTDKERDLRLKLMGEFFHQEKQSKSVKEETRITEWDYYSYGSSEEEFRLKRLHFYHQVAGLRPQMDMFLAMLRDAKLKCRSLRPDDSKQLLYRNLIHQLCRVLTVINDRMSTMPTDGNLLLDWAKRVLCDYKRYQKPTIVSGSESSSSCWTLPNGFTHRTVLNGSLPNARFNHVRSGVHGSKGKHSRTCRQVAEANHEIAEISAVHLRDVMTDPIEV